MHVCIYVLYICVCMYVRMRVLLNQKTFDCSFIHSGSFILRWITRSGERELTQISWAGPHSAGRGGGLIGEESTGTLSCCNLPSKCGPIALEMFFPRQRAIDSRSSDSRCRGVGVVWVGGTSRLRDSFVVQGHTAEKDTSPVPFSEHPSHPIPSHPGYIQCNTSLSMHKTCVVNIYICPLPLSPSL